MCNGAAWATGQNYCAEVLFAVYVQPINYPAMPGGMERLRIIHSPLHTDADSDRLVEALGRTWSQLSLRRAT
jgi:5-aminolevulinate synthase